MQGHASEWSRATRLMGIWVGATHPGAGSAGGRTWRMNGEKGQCGLKLALINFLNCSPSMSGMRAMDSSRMGIVPVGLGKLC